MCVYTTYLKRIFYMFIRACWIVPLVILFRCFFWVLQRMFSTKGVVSVSKLYWLLLLKDIGTEIKLYSDNSLTLLDLGLDFVLSCRLLICQRYSGQYISFARWLISSISVYLQFIYDTFAKWLAPIFWSTCMSTLSIVEVRGL